MLIRANSPAHRPHQTLQIPHTSTLSYCRCLLYMSASTMRDRDQPAPHSQSREPTPQPATPTPRLSANTPLPAVDDLDLSLSASPPPGAESARARTPQLIYDAYPSLAKYDAPPLLGRSLSDSSHFASSSASPGVTLPRLGQPAHDQSESPRACFRFRTFLPIPPARRRRCSCCSTGLCVCFCDCSQQCPWRLLCPRAGLGNADEELVGVRNLDASFSQRTLHTPSLSGRRPARPLFFLLVRSRAFWFNSFISPSPPLCLSVFLFFRSGVHRLCLPLEPSFFTFLNILRPAVMST